MEYKYEIVRYRPEFKTEILKLQTHLWSPDLNLNARYFEWKYELNPYLDSILIYMALGDRKVVGMRGMYGARWQIGNSNHSFLVPCAGDFVIDPDHRNRGLLTEIMKAAFSDLDKLGHKYVFNLSAGRITLLGSLAMSWRSVGSMEVMKLHRNSETNKKPTVKRTLHPSDEILHPFHYLDRICLKRSHNVSPHVQSAESPRPEEMAELVARVGVDGRISHSRDKQYFTWRFLNPLSLYRFLYWQGSKMEGYVVLQTPVLGDNINVNIVDWLSNNLEVLTELLHVVVQLGDFANINIWTATVPEDVKKVLRNFGFSYSENTTSITKSKHMLLLRSISNKLLGEDWILENHRLLDMTNWSLRMAYSDNY